MLLLQRFLLKDGSTWVVHIWEVPSTSELHTWNGHTYHVGTVQTRGSGPTEPQQRFTWKLGPWCSHSFLPKRQTAYMQEEDTQNVCLDNITLDDNSSSHEIHRSGKAREVERRSSSCPGGEQRGGSGEMTTKGYSTEFWIDNTQQNVGCKTEHTKESTIYIS